MNLTSRIQQGVIRSSPYPPFRWIYAAAYGGLLLWLVMRMRRIPEIRRLELRAPRKGHRFGVSDLDVRAETTALTSAEFFALSERLADVLRPAKRWMRILDFYLFGPIEAQLQRRLGPISFGDSRWIRLLGPKSVPARRASPPARAQLSRAMYEYGYLSQGLFEGSLTAHFTWSLFRRLRRIDDEFASGPQTLDSELARLRESVVARADRIARGGRLRAAKDADLEDLFALAIAEVNSISEITPCHARETRGDKSFQATVRATAPENLHDAVASCSAAISDLGSGLGGLIEGAMLGCVPGTAFDYRMYLILREGLKMRELAEVFRAIRELYTVDDSYRRIPSTYLRLRHPMVLTPSMWRASSRWYHALRPVEEFFFLQRHGIVLWGKDLRAELTQPSDLDVIRSGAIAVSDLRSTIWGAIHDRRPRQLADAVLGRVPALWLLFAQSTVATTSAEALAGCAAAGLANVSSLDNLRQRLSAMRPENLPNPDDPIWKPALEVASRWMDEIAQMALARLEAGSDASMHPALDAHL